MEAVLHLEIVWDLRHHQSAFTTFEFGAKSNIGQSVESIPLLHVNRTDAGV
jgi:hypothetical protein